jgi:hypothetical protein
METAVDNLEGEITESRAEVEGSSPAEAGLGTILKVHGAKILGALVILAIGWLLARTLPHVFKGASQRTEADQDRGAVET